MRVLVCGGRNMTDSAFVHRVLDQLHKNEGIDCIIHGAARGADRIGGYWARKNRIDERRFPADWEAHHNAAGPIRNQQMLDEGMPDLVVAFPDPKSTGTWDMVRRARKAGVETLIFERPLPARSRAS